MSGLDATSVSAIRVLSADAIQKADSGHPGLPLRATPIAYELWARHMSHNPTNPQWENCDRFILSGGYGSMLLYSLLHLFGYGDLSKEDIMNFRQMGSLTPGHPEYRHTMGMEATTGPLRAGMGMTVGMMMAESCLAAVFNRDEYPVVGHCTYVLGGDGCMMEGISSEAFSLAGTPGLSKLIVFHDSNRTSIEESTDITFAENVQMWMEASGFQAITVGDGNDSETISRAVEGAKADTERSSFITVKTQIGYGCPAGQSKASAHGELLGAEDVLALRGSLRRPSQEPFCVPEGVYGNYRNLADEKAEMEAVWNVTFAAYCEEYPGMEELWNQHHDTKAAESLWDDETFWAQSEKPDTARNLSGKTLSCTKDRLPNLFGGSTDLAPSNKTNMSGAGDFSKETPEGRNLHFGIRELAMTATGNGIMFHGDLRAYVATFFMSSGCVKPMARLSALMRVPLIFALTHDSIDVGEDGPTHEPIEQLAMLGAMSNFHMFRPYDTAETAIAWYSVVTSEKAPTVLVLTRQDPVPVAESSRDALKSSYVIDDCEGVANVTLMAGGSGVELAVKTKAVLENQGTKVQVVSMPCMDLFEGQTEEYKESILPEAVRKRMTIKALSDFGWGKYVGLDGAYVTMKGFSASGPAAQLFEHFGFTVDHIVATVEGL